MSEPYMRPTHTKSSLNAKPTKAPFGYHGAKQRLAKRIVGKFPPHNAWVEGFCGSAALTFAKKPAPIEVINDLDGQIVNFFKQLRNNSEALCEAVSLTPYAREEFGVSRNPNEKLDSLEKARRFLINTMMTVNGTMAPVRCGFSFSQSYSRGGREARVNRWYELPQRLSNVVERLRGVRIENRDACELLRMFSDRPATLFYLDPPYFTKRTLGYVIDARDRQFHVRLLKECNKAKCMILLSGYQNDLYDEFLTPKKGWVKSAIETSTRNTTGKDFTRTEVFWMNSIYSKALESGNLQIRLTKSELHNKKLNPSRKG